MVWATSQDYFGKMSNEQVMDKWCKYWEEVELNFTWKGQNKLS